MNIVVGHAAKTDSNTVTVGRNCYVSTAANQSRLSLSSGLEALRSFVFSARAATERVLINVQVRNLPFLIAAPLTELVIAFRNSRGARYALSPFLRLVSVEVTHIRRRGKSSSILPRYKTISGLAQPRDGRDLSHPPRVPRDGAGAQEVEFWLEESESAPEGSSKKGKKRSEANEGRYISVSDFFRTSKCHIINRECVDRFRAQYYHRRPIAAGCKRRDGREPVLPAVTSVQCPARTSSERSDQP